MWKSVQEVTKTGNKFYSAKIICDNCGSEQRYDTDKYKRIDGKDLCIPKCAKADHDPPPKVIKTPTIKPEDIHIFDYKGKLDNIDNYQLAWACTKTGRELTIEELQYLNKNHKKYFFDLDIKRREDWYNYDIMDSVYIEKFL